MKNEEDGMIKLGGDGTKRNATKWLNEQGFIVREREREREGLFLDYPQSATLFYVVTI